MPITQERTSALITAARSYQERYSSVISVIELLHKMVCDGAITATDAIERLHVQFGEKGLPLDATIVLEREFTHYKLTRKRNDYMREYQRRRRSAGAPSDAPCGAPSDDAMSRGASRAPSDAASANAMSLAEIEAALARVSRGVAAPSSNAAALRAPSSNASAETAPSAAFDAELSADDLL